MTNAIDDLEAVRKICELLEPFEDSDRETIIRWSRERLGMSSDSVHTKQDIIIASELPEQKTAAGKSAERVKVSDIKSFVLEKNPRTDTQFAAVIAYFYLFEVEKALVKESISGDGLQEACRQTSRPRLKDPTKTLNNAYAAGYLDKAADTGVYILNTVGENLVAMVLPDGSSVNGSSTKKKKKTAKKKAITKKPTN